MESNFRIPIPESDADFLAATVRLKPPSSVVESGSNQPIVIICHGIKAHKNNPSLLSLLADNLPVSSLRFDFRGSGDSSGSVLTMLDYYRCLHDLSVVYDWLSARNWRISCIIGHSMGEQHHNTRNMVGLLYALHNPTRVPLFVNISGRFDMLNGLSQKCIRDGVFSQQVIDEALSKWRCREAVLPETVTGGGDNGLEVAVNGWWGGATDLNGNRLKGRVVKYSVSLDRAFSMWARIDNELANISLLPQSLQTLTVHGTLDEIVPVADATSFANVLPSHTLVLIQNGNHNLNSKIDLPVSLDDKDNDANNIAAQTTKATTHAQIACDIIVKWVVDRGINSSKI
ncbi:hypothetical protein HK100_011241 [Physocladia obscura]|uniref:Serine aminopeptidase S33 domain-containing protein n=1 Tax=Physocladia obscura TaxID=109957 RepID=A0AAD5XGR4_9FUNG|nr:hypothetical protein HK100_011241 [Physocladia obscura]